MFDGGSLGDLCSCKNASQFKRFLCFVLKATDGLEMSKDDGNEIKCFLSSASKSHSRPLSCENKNRRQKDTITIF